ncbi:hypothetical protein DXV75_11710 [Alteromonas aestuariivivens]|uniref:Amidohydrolase n=1 Tax=Alteromonas aestuariivivens TaxID=1938339 RepID=A0A3D8M676_9ALTE|nr:hypothetical protein DXV75_11710 [Alteromonas aestuariivivens]
MNNVTAALMLLCSFSSFASIPNGRHIVVDGRAQVSAIPDLAVLHFNGETIRGTKVSATDMARMTI